MNKLDLTWNEEILKDFKQTWEERVGAPPEEELVKAFCNVDMEPDMKFILTYDTTTVLVDCKDPKMLRCMKTLWGTWGEIIAENPDMQVYYLNHEKLDEVGNTRYDVVEKEERPNIMVFYRMYHQWKYIWPSLGTITLEEVIEDDTISQEIKSMLFSLPSMNLTDRLTKVDTYVHEATQNGERLNGVYDLFKGTLMDIPCTYVRTWDASTDRMFCLAVDESITKARDAAPWLMTMPRDLIPHIKTICRQGEKFTVTWDTPEFQRSEAYAKKMKSPPEHIPADIYWSKMTFET